MLRPSRLAPALHSSLRLGVVIGVTTVASVAFAHRGGISGYSGKQSETCTACHDGNGPAPTVKITGPTSLDAGATGFYTFRITTTNKGAGLNAAVSDGQLHPDDAGTTRIEQYTDFNTDISTDEITHNNPLPVVDAGAEGGIVTFSFSMTAPAYGGTMTMYAAGNAVNLDDTEDGDNSSKDKLDIMVYGPPKPPTPDASAPAPAPTTAPTKTGPPVNDSPPTTDAGLTNGAAPANDSSSCAIGWADQGTLPAGAMLGGLVGLAALTRRRRRRR